MERTPYPTDVTDEQWKLVEPCLPDPKPGGRPRKTDLREVLNALFYLVRGGCQCVRSGAVNLGERTEAVGVLVPRRPGRFARQQAGEQDEGGTDGLHARNRRQGLAASQWQVANLAGIGGGA